MFLTELEITMQEALQDLGIPQLPGVLPKEDYGKLVDGIALVTKVGGIRSYVRVSGAPDNKVVVVKDYGTSAAIRSIDYVYAKSTLNLAKYRPNLRSQQSILEFFERYGHSREEAEQLMSKTDKTPEQIKEDKEKLNAIIMQITIKIARERIADDEHILNKLRNGKRTDKED